MKIVCVSDTHRYHNDLTMPEGDVLVHSGDIDAYTLKDFAQFLHWMKKQDYKHKIFVAGNHDFFCQNSPYILIKSLCEESGIIYLQDEAVVINNIRFYGSPWTPTFGGWAFMRDRGNRIALIWDKIPDKVDVLITHGPPYKILDRGYRNEHAGCYDLLLAVRRVKPKYHIFGHIHEESGIVEGDDTTFVNASMIDHNYKSIRTPIVVEI